MGTPREEEGWGGRGGRLLNGIFGADTDRDGRGTNEGLVRRGRMSYFTS